MDSNQIIENYILEFKEILEINPEFKAELFDNEYALPEVFWQLFKEQAIINLMENGDPLLTAEQLKDVHKNMFLHSIVETMEELRKKGLVEGDEIDGYSLTQVAKEILIQPKE